MIYYTGDIHGQKYEIVRFCKRFNLTREDTVVILGDVAANYYGILGDVIDRKPDGIRLLRRIMKTPNIKMLLGNHEYMMMDALVYADK